MKSSRRMSFAGALAVAIAILPAPIMPATARADSPSVSPGRATPAASFLAQATPPAADSAAAPRIASPADSAATVPSTPPPSVPTRLVPVQPDTSASSPARSDSTAIAPAPADTVPAPAPRLTPPPVPAPGGHLPIRKERARPARTARPAAPQAAAAAVQPWSPGSNWVTADFGYAHSGEPGAAPGQYGGGLTVRHMITSRWSVALGGGFDLLGRFGTAKDVEVPVTLRVARHFAWKTVVHPYAEAGLGWFRHQFRGTGQDTHDTGTGFLLTGGLDLSTGGHSLIGAFARYEQVHRDQGPPNPVFDGERTIAVRYAYRVAWSVIF